jgi:hypothetical protein
MLPPLFAPPAMTAMATAETTALIARATSA